jgi:hypothetical protein
MELPRGGRRSPRRRPETSSPRFDWRAPWCRASRQPTRLPLLLRWLTADPRARTRTRTMAQDRVPSGPDPPEMARLRASLRKAFRRLGANDPEGPDLVSALTRGSSWGNRSCPDRPLVAVWRSEVTVTLGRIAEAARSVRPADRRLASAWLTHLAGRQAVQFGADYAGMIPGGQAATRRRSVPGVLSANR